MDKLENFQLEVKIENQEEDISNLSPNNFQLHDLPNDYSIENKLICNRYQESLTTNPCEFNVPLQSQHEQEMLNQTFIQFNNFKVDIPCENQYNYQQLQQQQLKHSQKFQQEFQQKNYIQDQFNKENLHENILKNSLFAQIFLKEEYDQNIKLETDLEQQSHQQINFNNNNYNNNTELNKNSKPLLCKKGLEKRQICGKKIKTHSSTNITKNFISGICQYIDSNKSFIIQWAKKQNLVFEDSEFFFQNNLKIKKKKLYSINHLKKLLTLPNTTYGKIYRIFGFKFLRQEAFQFINSRKIKDKANQLKFRHSIYLAFLDPQSFVHLIL